MSKRNKYLVEIYRAKKTYKEESLFYVIKFKIVVYKNSEPDTQLLIDLVSSHVFRKRLSKKYIETIMDSKKETPNITKIIPIGGLSVESWKKLLIRNYAKIKDV